MQVLLAVLLAAAYVVTLLWAYACCTVASIADDQMEDELEQALKEREDSHGDKSRSGGD